MTTFEKLFFGYLLLNTFAWTWNLFIQTHSYKMNRNWLTKKERDDLMYVLIAMQIRLDKMESAAAPTRADEGDEK